MAKQLIIDRLLETASKQASGPMVAASNVALSYHQLWSRALQVASVLITESRDEPLIGFLSDRDQTAYLAILSILAAGKGYVPLNPALPDARLKRILSQARLQTVLIGRGQSRRAMALFSTATGGVRTLVSLEDAETSHMPSEECHSRPRYRGSSATSCATRIR